MLTLTAWGSLEQRLITTSSSSSWAESNFSFGVYLVLHLDLDHIVEGDQKFEELNHQRQHCPLSICETSRLVLIIRNMIEDHMKIFWGSWSYAKSLRGMLDSETMTLSREHVGHCGSWWRKDSHRQRTCHLSSSQALSAWWESWELIILIIIFVIIIIIIIIILVIIIIIIIMTWLISTNNHPSSNFCHIVSNVLGPAIWIDGFTGYISAL